MRDGCFERAIRRLQRHLDRFDALDQRLLRWRFALLLALLAALAWALLSESGLAWLLSAAVLAVHMGVAAGHHRLRRRRGRFQAELQRQESQRARRRLDWMRIPPPAAPAEDVTSLEADLDLVGPESLHRLLDDTLTEGGSGRLRRLLSAAGGAVAERQALVKELEPLQLLRGRLHRSVGSAAGASGRLSTKGVGAWAGGTSRIRELRRSAWIASLLAASAALLLVLDLLAGWGRLWLLPLLGNLLYLLSQQEQIRTVFGRGLELEAEYGRLGELFGLLEAFRCEGRPHLSQLLEPVQSGQNRPSSVFSRTARLVSLLSVRAYPLLWLPLNVVFPWDFWLGLRLERLRLRTGRAIAQWLGVLHRLDAAQSLALFAFSHPGYAFPRLEPGAVPLLESRRLGHPLIPSGRRVCNDFRIGGDTRITLITGSNMSGKSTFLRTVGINLQLARAGAPVCAESMRTSVFEVFSCIRVSDSVMDGFSYFYAEVQRLRRLLERLEEPGEPVFFLIDEIFKGTNNRERLIGSRSFVRTLAESDGLGLVSTHDLELTGLADQLPGLVNLHFREEVSAGRMIFDYRLRPGPCPTTNALEIMKSAGLPVEE